jgi:RND family efflux transporter MFP subunit
MKKKHLIIFLSSLAFATFLGACDRTPQAHTKPVPKSWTLPVIKASGGAPVEYAAVGSVVSDQRVEVTSRLSGYIREILVQEGDRVRRGQLLVRLDAADVEGGISQGRAAVAAAEAAFHDAQTDRDHFKQLFERGSVSDNEMRKVRLKFDAARETLNQARAGLNTANSQRNYAEIKSPVDGLVVAKVKRAGDLALPGVPILTLESGRKLLFETFVAEEAVASVVVGNNVEVRLDRHDAPIKGIVSRVVSSADPVTRSYQVKISLPETAGLMPGMFGRAAFMLGKSKSTVVPASALVERGGLRGVFVVNSESTAQFRWLRIGREWPDRVEVMAGLEGGERVVAVADPTLRDGDKIVGAGVRND